MENVEKFYPKDAAKNPDNVLEQARGDYSDVLILGWNHNDDFDPRASLGLSPERLLWLVEIFKQKLMSGDYMAEE